MAVIQRLIDLKQQLHAASGNPREKSLALVAQLSAAKGKLAEVRRELALQLRRLEEQLAVGTTPGAGFREVQRVLWTLDRAQLPREDPLAVRALQLVGRWETSNVALRDKAKLSSAVGRTSAGFSKQEPFAGQRLGSALIEVRTVGSLGAGDLVDARSALTKWQDLREKEAREDLRIASFYGDELALKESIALCRESGVSETELAGPVAQYQKLRWTQEVQARLQEAIESGDADILERAIAFSHSLNFVEEDTMMLQAATLLVQCRFWAEELTVALQTQQAEGLLQDVKTAQKISDDSNRFLQVDRETEGTPPDVVFDELEQHTRALDIVLPDARRFADLKAAEADLERVLGAVERYADELPAVIKQGRAKEAKPHLIKEAVDHLKAYEKTVADLRQAIAEHTIKAAEFEEAGAEVPPEELAALKDAMVKARMAGAPDELVAKANAQLKAVDDSDKSVFSDAQVELELRIALAEADDIKEMSVEDRFLRLQDAADAAQSLDPPLDKETMEMVDQTSIALAAERTLMLRKTEAERILQGDVRPTTAASSGSSSASSSNRRRSFKTSFNKRGTIVKMEAAVEQVEDTTSALRTAIVAAEMSALEEAKKVIPEAEALFERLEEEGPQRQAALRAAREEAKKWRGRVSDLRALIIAAREANVAESLLDDAYTELNVRKLSFLPMDLQAAVAVKQRAIAAGLAIRGRVLRGYAREGGPEGGPVHLMKTISALCPSPEGVITVQGMIRGSSCGGVYGGQSWRKNPLFVIRQVVQRTARKHSAQRRGEQVLRVSIAVAEGSSKLATLAVHVVQNCKGAAAALAACGYTEMLMPGFETLAGSSKEDDLPYCEFELPPPSFTETRPVFIVPSGARGEEGMCTLVVQATGNVEVREARYRESQLFSHQWSTEVKWCDSRPFAKTCGGGRVAESAPLLSWYRNPQFRVRVAAKEDEDDEGLKSIATSWPFAAGEDTALEQTLQPVTEEASEQALKTDPEAKPEAEEESDDDEFSEDDMELGEAGRHTLADAALGKPRVPLLQVVMVPRDKQQRVPVAVHIVRNLASREECVQENSMLHASVASSCTADVAYQIASEVGTVCELPEPPPDQEKGQGEPVFVVPSLETQDSEGAFTLNVLSTVPVDIERVN